MDIDLQKVQRTTLPRTCPSCKGTAQTTTFGVLVKGMESPLCEVCHNKLSHSQLREARLASEVRTCTSCGETKPKETFLKHRPFYCKQCKNEDERKRRSTPEGKQARAEERQRYREKNRERLSQVRKKRYAENTSEEGEKAKNHTHHIRKLFGLTKEDYQNMLLAQNGRCAICGIEAASCSKRLAVDHDHVTGNIRGLLCNTCNSGIGYFEPNPKLLVAAIRYLLEYASWNEVPDGLTGI